LRQELTTSLPGAGGQTANNPLPSDLLRQPKCIVIGLGNPILGDDGFGWIVADQVRQHSSLQTDKIDIECFSLGGLSLMERLVGYDSAILIDAIHLGQSPVGTIHVLPLADIPDNLAGHLSSSHDTTLKTAIQMGRSLGAHLPESITVVGVETSNSYDFSEELSMPVASAVPAVVQIVVTLLDTQG
jgi:hydrogenase maturation protease